MNETLTKTDVINIINEGFEQVILPHIVEIKDDVHGLKSDVNDLRSDVGDLQSDVTDLKSDVSNLQSDVTSCERRL